MALTAAAAAGGLAAAAAYLNGKYQLSRDINYFRKMKQAEKLYIQNLQQDRLSPWYILADTATRQPNDRAIWTRQRSYTFQELHDHTARYAQWLLSKNIRSGDLVALYLTNSAEFIMIMFALHSIGAGPALMNYNLEGKALMHCLKVAGSKLVIVDEDSGCQSRIEGVRGEIEGELGAEIVVLGANLKADVEAREVVVPADDLRRGMKPNWPYALIYTSGTTGLPKGCPFTLSRLHLLGSHISPPFGQRPGHDCWYSPMPLYHGTGIITTTANLLAGVGCAIAPRFSVKNFWPDIHDSGATMFIYVGETARYLLAAPTHPLERKHRLRVAYGNGLRPDIWTKFQTRFNIPEIAEFFNSSEGMFGLIVWSRNSYTAGCVGHNGLISRLLLKNIYIPVRIDHETGDIFRDPKTGFAERMSYEEGGEILVAVKAKTDFGGYWKNEEATNKRFATDVFKKGDIYYRCGDALRRGNDGHWYFMDRLGDTFRWKSENVSTAEVAETLGRFSGIAEANVYGVEVPGHEGRAGCAALQLSADLPASGVDDKYLTDLLRYCSERLPRYAVPVFLRIQKRSSHIHNHKQNKVPLRNEGVDPNKIGTLEKEGADDAILWWRPGTSSYVPFRREDWEEIVRGSARL